jgi:hypothetical protein
MLLTKKRPYKHGDRQGELKEKRKNGIFKVMVLFLSFYVPSTIGVMPDQ